MDQIQIQQMTENDLDQVMRIEEASFSVPWHREDFLEGLHRDNSIYLVAKQGLQVVGYCGVWGVLDEGQINNVAVAKECRGHKIGSRLIETLFVEGRKRQLKSYTLEVRVSNEPAIALYKKNGFEEAGIRKNYYQNPKEDAMIMWKYE